MDQQISSGRLLGGGLVVALPVVSAGCSALGGADAGDPQNATNATTTAQHDHSETGTDSESNTGHSSAAVTGQMAVVVAGDELDLTGAGSADAGFWFGDAAHTWHASGGNLTVAEALQTVGVDATANAVTCRGTTHRERDPGVDVAVQVDRKDVDPSEYLLRDGHRVRIVVGKEP